MTFNKNIILGILLSKFSENIESEIIYSVLDMDEYELEHIFGQLTDYADLDDVGEMEVDSFEVQLRGQREEVSGALKVEVFLDGYAHWGEEDEFVDSIITIIRFRFSFIKEENKYSEFKMSRIFPKDRF